jgi:ribosomal protein L11 methyltransferase
VTAWLSLRVTIDAAAAEAFSDALLLAGAQSSAIDQPDSPAPTVSALLSPDADPRSVIGKAAALCRLASAPAFALTRLEDDDWVRRTQSQFVPLEIGRLWIGPTWREPPAAKPAIVRLDPGLAFGTGSHPSTRLALAYLERELGGGERVLDYGCGSGILAIAAAKLGAQHVDAVDVDEQAIEVALRNAEHNAVHIAVSTPERLGAALYDVVVSNILAQPLILLAPLLAARSAAHGRIALSGILDSQAEEVGAAYRPWFDIGVWKSEPPWALLAGARK